MGSNLFDELGVLRTLELLASDRYYGVEQRFSHVAYFGYSKNAKRVLRSGRDMKRRLGIWFAPSDVPSGCSGRTISRFISRWSWTPRGCGSVDA